MACRSRTGEVLHSTSHGVGGVLSIFLGPNSDLAAYKSLESRPMYGKSHESTLAHVRAKRKFERNNLSALNGWVVVPLGRV